MKILGISNSDPKKLSSDSLYKFISNSIQTRYPLFAFLNIEKLSESNFNDLYNGYIQRKSSSSNFYYDFLKTDLIYIKKLRDNHEKNIEIQNVQSKNQQLSSEIKQLSNENKQLSNENLKLRNQVKSLNNQLSNIPPFLKSQMETYNTMMENQKKIAIDNDGKSEKNTKINFEKIKIIIASLEKKCNGSGILYLNS